MHISVIENLEFTYHNNPANKAAYLLLHGIRGGIHEAYTQALFTKLKSRGDTILAINFPYMSRGEDRTAMSNLSEEIKALQTAVDFLRSVDKTPIHIIGKSFGGIVASHWLSEDRRGEDTDLSIMGFVPGEGNILTASLGGKLRVVIQGQYDAYASPAKVRSELSAHQIDADVIEITNADHSYRDITNTNLAEYGFQDIAIAELLKLI